LEKQTSIVDLRVNKTAKRARKDKLIALEIAKKHQKFVSISLDDPTFLT